MFKQIWQRFLPTLAANDAWRSRRWHCRYCRETLAIVEMAVRYCYQRFMISAKTHKGSKFSILDLLVDNL